MILWISWPSLLFRELYASMMFGEEAASNVTMTITETVWSEYQESLPAKE